MPRYSDPDADLSDTLKIALMGVRRALDHLSRQTQDVDSFEGNLKAVLDASGRQAMRDFLGRLSENEPFEEEGATWSVALTRPKSVMTVFGWVKVPRPLFRSRRNGPTRCLVSERANLVEGKWTPRAARVAAVATTELSFQRTQEFLAELGGLAPSKTLLLKLDGYLSSLWEKDRQANEEEVRKSLEIPAEASACVVSLDGVMVHTVGSDRLEKRAAAKAAGKLTRGPNGCKEASVGVLSFYDAKGKRLETWRMARMPESDKATTKAWLKAELAAVRARRPDLVVVAAADGTPNNWSFLDELDPDEQVVDYYHTTQNLYARLSKLGGSAELLDQRYRDFKRTLLEEEGGGLKVWSALKTLEAEAGIGANRTRKCPPSFFERHAARMNYSSLRGRNLPIGTGVTEGTCRYLVVDRLRRSGMAWSREGGQAVMTLRSLVASGRLGPAWGVLARANAARLTRAA